MLNLNFSAAIANTIEDQNGEGTGFTSVKPNKNGDQYNRSRINLNKTAGNLVLTATQGSSARGANTLKNALQVALNGSKTFTVSTRLTAPLNFSTAFQQGGIFVGNNQNNYVKLVLVNDSLGDNGLKVQFYKEETGIGSSVGEIKNLDWGNIKTLDLFLIGNPFVKKISAAYRVNSNSAAPTVLSRKFTPNQTASFFGNASKNRAGIIASTTNAPDVVVTFDNFGIAQDVKINFQSNNAPLPTGYIKDSGQAFSVSRGFGWVTQAVSGRKPLNISPYARDRNRPGVDQRIDTLLHMQYPNTTPAAWEYAVPNGTYAVTVSVGDKPNDQGVYDSKHTVRVEGITAINQFQSTPKQQYQLATVKVNVNDGKLTVDAIGGVNTKLNYLEIDNITPGKHPNVTGTSIARDATGVYRDAAVNVDVNLPIVGAGVNQNTLNTTNVKLYRTIDGASVPGIVGTSGGGDAIVYQPSVKLAPNTNYTFKITSNVRDDSGAKFIPYSRTFNTGVNTSVADSAVNFSKSTVFTGAPLASLTIGPDSKLYAAGLDGKLRRWTINAASGTLSDPQTFAPPTLAGRAIIGIAFDPKNPNNLWLSHNDPLFPQPGKDFTGKISKLTLNPNTGSFDANVQDYVVNLPRSAKDHLTNSLAFGPDGKLYLTQGSNSAMGAPDAAWAQRSERLLSATVLQIDPDRTPPSDGFNVQTENFGSKPGNYNPFAPDAPVKIYATGVRNAYDLVWHSNGNLYTAANGSAANGNTPDDPRTPANEGLTGVSTQNDYLFKIQPGGYYGHPNPLRQEYVMNGANPTSGVDPAEVVSEVSSTGKTYAGYPVGTQPDPNYRGAAHDFGRNRSPNGIIEYKSNNFNGALKNQLLVVEYSGGDDILALKTGADGNIPRGNVTQVVDGLADPLDLVEDTRKNAGNIYVAELIGGGTSGKISLLKAS